MKKTNLSFINDFLERFFASDKIVNPKRDWMILLALFFVMLISAALYDASLYKNIASGDMYVSVPKSELELETIGGAALQNVVNDFESRKANTAELKMQKLIDPSL